jgi:hypothetical protein
VKQLAAVENADLQTPKNGWKSAELHRAAFLLTNIASKVSDDEIAASLRKVKSLIVAADETD